MGVCWGALESRRVPAQGTVTRVSLAGWGTEPHPAWLWKALPGSYEIRHYGPAKWVSTSVESMDWDSAIQTGFTKLNSYIQGKNEKEMKIKMTAPVTSYVEPGSGPFSLSMDFLVPKRIKNNF
uniref:Heme binding protein 2 n=1 Tax=Cebus imitator TaxID=2715852 RepID=A0A2K5Q299_CEBIM